MTIVVEDGSIVAGANAFHTLDELRAYALERGVTLSSVDADLEPKVHLAMDWFRYLSHRGTLVDTTQTTPYPRKGVVVDGIEYDEDEIPPLVIAVCMQAAMYSVEFELEPAYAGSSEGRIKKEKVDELETEFFNVGTDGASSTESPRIRKLQKMVAPLIGGYAAGRVEVRRV